MTHLGVVAHNVFYNKYVVPFLFRVAVLSTRRHASTPKDMLLGGKVPIPDPMNVDPRLSRLGIQRVSRLSSVS